MLQRKDNHIQNVYPLRYMTKLEVLDLSFNEVAYITEFDKLVSLSWLDLTSNEIENISALAANTGLKSGDELYITENPLNQDAACVYIPILQKRGVYVLFDVACSEL